MQAKAKLPSTAFTLNTSCSSYSGSERRQASLKRHVGLARGGLAFALFFFLLSYIFHFPAQVKINLPSHVKALKYLHIVIVKPQMKTVFAQVVGYFFCLFFFFFLEREKGAFPPRKPGARGVLPRCDKFQEEHLQQSTLNHNSDDPIRRAARFYRR